MRCFGAKDIFEAQNVADGLRLMESCGPDIILCDWMMYPEDGLVFLKKIRARGIHTPVIFITGHGTINHVQEAIGSGADSYIVKPFKAQTLMEHLLKVVEAARPMEMVEI